MQPTTRIFKAYQDYRKAIGKSKPKLSRTAIQTIEQALEKHTAKELLTIIEYLQKAQDEYTKFFNGENEAEKFYGSINGIFRITKIAEKLMRAKAWKKKQVYKEAQKAHDLYFPFIIKEPNQNKGEA